MFLENLVLDAVEPQRLGRFWEAAVGSERLSDEPDGFETRLAVDGGPVLDLCLQRVPEPPSERPRLLPVLLGGDRRAAQVGRLLGLGARRLDTDRDEVPWVVLADPEGNPFGVSPEQGAYTDTGPIAALALDSGDPDRDAEFWSWLTGWVDAPGVAPRALRHPSLRGPVLELHSERAPKAAPKNRLHLDARLEPGDDPDEVAAGITERGGQEIHPDWGELPWRLYVDPSGNELCVLPAPS